MTLLVFTMRRAEIARRKHELNWELFQIKQKLTAMTDYATKISDNSVSIADLMKVNPSMFNRMSMYMMYSNQAALAGAQEKMAYAMATPGAMAYMQNPQMMQMYQAAMFKNFYQQEREKFMNTERKVLDEQNKKLDARAAQIQQQLDMMEAELKSTQEAEKAAIQASAPKYVA